MMICFNVTHFVASLTPVHGQRNTSPKKQIFNAYLVQVYVLLTTLISQPVYSQVSTVCPTGWFGEGCKYLCHCPLRTVCGRISGECPGNDPCTVGFFGPGCQFVHLKTDNSVPAFLHDNNDRTCNPDPTASSVMLLLIQSYPFSWFRIVVKKKKLLLNFTTTLNDGQQCRNERKFQVSDTIVDVTCDVFTNVGKLRIHGAIAGSICSVYISGGRNVALQQQTNQTSIFKYHTSDRAVDGSNDPNLDHQHCSSTITHTPPPWWLLTFNRPHILYFIRIYNRDEAKFRLNEFKLETFQENGNIVFSYQDRSRTDPNDYAINVHSHTAVTKVKITQGPRYTGFDRILTLCEVEIYGDNTCPVDKYGFDCQHSCFCNRTEICNVVTGACAPGCPAGYYGPNCASLCSVNCSKGICAWATGHCLQCRPGYMGNMCEQECKSGYYGINCLYSCSDHCKDICNPENGSCMCKAQFTGEECAECIPGYYGPECTQDCSDGCQDMCDTVSGNCTCKDKFIGPQCTDCAFKFYGENCETKCPTRCLKRRCAKTSGKCLSCEYGFIGDYCQYESWSYLLIGFALWMLLFWMVLFARRNGHYVSQGEVEHY